MTLTPHIEIGPVGHAMQTTCAAAAQPAADFGNSWQALLAALGQSIPASQPAQAPARSSSQVHAAPADSASPNAGGMVQQRSLAIHAPLSNRSQGPRIIETLPAARQQSDSARIAPQTSRGVPDEKKQSSPNHVAPAMQTSEVSIAAAVPQPAPAQAAVRPIGETPRDGDRHGASAPADFENAAALPASEPNLSMQATQPHAAWDAPAEHAPAPSEQHFDGARRAVEDGAPHTKAPYVADAATLVAASSAASRTTPAEPAPASSDPGNIPVQAAPAAIASLPDLPAASEPAARTSDPAEPAAPRQRAPRSAADSAIAPATSPNKVAGEPPALAPLATASTHSSTAAARLRPIAAQSAPAAPVAAFSAHAAAEMPAPAAAPVLAAVHAISHARSEQPEHAPASAAAPDAFAALDRSNAQPSLTWTHAGARQAEAGYLDPALGWIGVRAETTGNALHAALLPGTPEAAQTLAGHIAGLNTFLAERHGQSAYATLNEASQNAYSQPGQGNSQQQEQSDPAPPQVSPHTGAREAMQAQDSPRPAPVQWDSAPRGSASLISVMA